SKADMCSALAHVRFAPNSDRECGFPQRVMSALPLKADMRSAHTDVCFGPIADMLGRPGFPSKRYQTLGFAGVEKPTTTCTLRAPSDGRPHHSQASELLARVPRSVLDLLDDLIKVPALGAL